MQCNVSGVCGQDCDVIYGPILTVGPQSCQSRGAGLGTHHKGDATNPYTLF